MGRLSGDRRRSGAPDRPAVDRVDVAGGMVLYSVINSPGYFVQKGQWPMVGMFAILFFLAVFLLMDAAFRQH